MKNINIRINFRFIILSILMLMIFVIVASILIVGIGDEYTPKNINKFDIKSSDVIFNNNKKKVIPTIKIYFSKQNKVQELNLEDYVQGVVSGEMPVEFPEEALKAQAIAARTFALAHMKQYGGSPCPNAKGGDICDTVHCQVYKNKQDRIKSWPKEKANEYYNKIKKAVQQTCGQVLIYKGKIVQNPYYFAVSSGKTEDAKDVFASDIPYLKPVESKGEEIAKKYKSTFKISYKTLAEEINRKYPKAKVSVKNLKTQIKIIKRSKVGSVLNIKLGNVTIRGSEFRRLLKLNSANFQIKFNKKDIQIDCKGYGHGVGMSQWGANAMAKSGKKYDEILKHYYNGTSITNIYKNK